jgi:hypothetical protein
MAKTAAFFDDVLVQNSCITLADGRTISCTGIGNGKLRSVDDKGRQTTVDLRDVLLVPGLNNNLLSVNVLTAAKMIVEFAGNTCRVKKDGDVILLAEKRGNLYAVK